jgi:hypothetical protein
MKLFWQFRYFIQQNTTGFVDSVTSCKLDIHIHFARIWILLVIQCTVAKRPDDAANYVANRSCICTASRY